MEANQLNIEDAADVCVVPMLANHGKHPEDGEDIVAENYRIWVTMRDGRRFEYNRAFSGLRWVEDYATEFGGYYENIQAASKASAAKIAAMIRAAGAINLDYWREIDPAYGSEQYQKQGIEAERAFNDQFDE